MYIHATYAATADDSERPASKKTERLADLVYGG